MYNLMEAIKKHYTKVTCDWTGSLYGGITLDWNYDERWVNTSMVGYVTKLRQSFNHKMPSRPVHSPYRAPKKVYGKTAQDTIKEDKSPKLSDKEVNIVQQVVGVCLYYGRAVENTVLLPLSTMAGEQTKTTEKTMRDV